MKDRTKTEPTPKAPQNEVNTMQQLQKVADNQLISMQQDGLSLSDAFAVVDMMAKLLQNRVKIVMDEAEILERGAR